MSTVNYQEGYVKKKRAISVVWRAFNAFQHSSLLDNKGRRRSI